VKEIPIPIGRFTCVALGSKSIPSESVELVLVRQTRELNTSDTDAMAQCRGHGMDSYHGRIYMDQNYVHDYGAMTKQVSCRPDFGCPGQA